MVETILYLNGNNPKTISYIDEDTKNYVTLKVKLKEEVSEFEFKKFLAELKYLKISLLSNGNTNLYLIQELKHCFKEILATDSIINLKRLFELMNNLETSEFTILNEKVEEFYNMFEIVNKCEYSLPVYNEMVRHLKTNQLFRLQDSNFEKEVDSMKYNSYFFNSEYLSKCEKLKQSSQNKKRTLTNIKSMG